MFTEGLSPKPDLNLHSIYLYSKMKQNAVLYCTVVVRWPADWRSWGAAAPTPVGEPGGQVSFICHLLISKIYHLICYLNCHLIFHQGARSLCWLILSVIFHISFRCYSTHWLGRWLWGWGYTSSSYFATFCPTYSFFQANYSRCSIIRSSSPSSTSSSSSPSWRLFFKGDSGGSLSLWRRSRGQPRYGGGGEVSGRKQGQKMEDERRKRTFL